MSLQEPKNRCCKEAIGRMCIMSPATCLSCGTTLAVRDSKWVVIERRFGYMTDVENIRREHKECKGCPVNAALARFDLALQNVMHYEETRARTS